MFLFKMTNFGLYLIVSIVSYIGQKARVGFS